jgi:hypothetical protein
MIAISLAACSAPLPQEIKISAKPVEKPPLTLPPVDELNLRKVEWIVINKDNIDAVKARLESQGQAFALYSLTGDGYGNLGLNFSDIRALVQQQQAIILAYENYYKESNAALDKVNQQIRDQEAIESQVPEKSSWLQRVVPGN